MNLPVVNSSVKCRAAASRSLCWNSINPEEPQRHGLGLRIARERFELRDGRRVLLCGEQQQRIIEDVGRTRVALRERLRLRERLLRIAREDPCAPQALA